MNVWPLSAIERLRWPTGSGAVGQVRTVALTRSGTVSLPSAWMSPHRQRANVGVSSPAWRLSWSKPSMNAS